MLAIRRPVLIFITFIPSLVVAGLGKYMVENFFFELAQERRQSIQMAVGNYLEQSERRILKALSGLASSERVDRLLVEMDRHELDMSRVTFIAKQWSEEYDLPVLSIADGEGRILSCANLTARAGEVDQLMLQLDQREKEGVYLLHQPLLEQGMMVRKPALVAFKKRVFESAVLFFLGGIFLDDKDWLQGLGRVCGADGAKVFWGKDEKSAIAGEGTVHVDLPMLSQDNTDVAWLEIRPKDVSAWRSGLLRKVHLLALASWFPVLLITILAGYWNRKKLL